MTDLPDYVLTNRAHWDKWAHDWVASGERNWTAEPTWGMWGIPETELRFLPDDMTGMDAIELGCGTGYVSGWLARRGARVVGIDNSEKQLATARRLADEHGVDLELIHGNAEMVPKPDASFDFAISEYGAAIWADPYKWVPEAHRLLRPGGTLVSLGTGVLASLTVPLDVEEPAGRTLLRSYFDLHRQDWDDGEDRGTEFNLPISEWFRLFQVTGFEVVGFYELRAPDPSDEVRFFAGADWSHDFPSEQVWKVCKPPVRECEAATQEPFKSRE